MKNILTSTLILLSTWIGSNPAIEVGVVRTLQHFETDLVQTTSPTRPEEVLSSRTLSLSNRHANSNINQIFKKNILLNLAYLEGSATKNSPINWQEVVQPQSFRVSLNPGETFAYHDHVLDEYKSSLALTTNTHFNASDGYLNSGFLFGDGVCHLASILNWAAQDAGLDVEVTKAHSIAPIPDIPDKYGVSIYTIESDPNSGTKNNMYITNNQAETVIFEFTYDEQDQVTVRVIKQVPVNTIG